MLRKVQEEFAARRPHPFYRDVGETRPQAKYLIAMTPRSGSTLLAQELSRALEVGHAGEFLNEGFITNFEHLFPPPALADFERFVLARFTSPNGVFGLKADWWRYSRARELGYLPRLYDDLDLIVMLTRRDFVGQAISLDLSIQTGIWHDSNIRFDDADERYAHIVYDDERITYSLLGLMQQEYLWERHFANLATPIIRLTYEAVIADLAGAMTRIAGALGVTPPHGGLWARPSMKPTPSRLNSEWKLRYLARHAELVEHWTENRGKERPDI